MLIGSAVVVVFTGARPGSRRVHTGLLVSDGWVHALWVVGFIAGRWVRSGAPLGSLCSSRVVWFAQVRPQGRWVHDLSFGLLGFALCIIAFIMCRWVRIGAPWGSLGSSGMVGIARMRPGGSLGLYGVVEVTQVHPRVRSVQAGSLGSLLCSLGVVQFFRGRWVHSGARRGPLGSFGVVWLTRARRVGCWVHPCRPWGWLGSYGIIGFTRVFRWIRSGLLGSLVHALGVDWCR